MFSPVIPVHLIPALPTSVLTSLPPSPHSTPSHFLLGNRWETGRRGNEQEERQTWTVTTVKETADIAPLHVDALSYRNWVVSHSAVGYKHGDLLLSGWILRVTALTLWWLSVTLTEQTHNTPGLTFKTPTLSNGEFYFSWDLSFYADLHVLHQICEFLREKWWLNHVFFLLRAKLLLRFSNDALKVCHHVLWCHHKRLSSSLTSSLQLTKRKLGKKGREGNLERIKMHFMRH